MNHHLKPWQVKTFTRSACPNLDDKNATLVGRCLHASEQLLAFSVDKKTSVHASIVPSRP